MNHMKVPNPSNSRSNLEARYHKYVNISFPGAYSLQPKRINVSSLSIRIFRVSLESVKRFSQFAKNCTLYLLYKIILMTLLFHLNQFEKVKSQKNQKK